MTALRFENVHKSFGNTTALSEVRFCVEPQTLGVVIGPSGCGKSSLLSLAAGLDKASSGRIFLGDREVRGIREDVALLLQDRNLFPWMTAQSNVAFGLTMRGVPRGQANIQALNYLNDVGLGACASKVPAELSGGMKQRVALARALALKPSILLMDEPFAALDYQTRKIMQRYLLAAKARTGATVLLVTHDLAEALTVADRVILFSSAPRTVQQIIDIQAPHPRDLSDPKFADVMRKLESHLEAEAAFTELTAEERDRIPINA
jgi:NitT/TauT family transport system ATP-binding protein